MLILPPQLTHRQARASLGMLLDAARAEEARCVVLDAAALTQFDSSALAVLLALRRACEKNGKTLSVVGMPQQLRELAGLYGVASLLVDTDAAAPADPAHAGAAPAPGGTQPAA